MKVVKRENPKSSHHKKKFFSFTLYLYEMWMFTKLIVYLFHDVYKSNHYAMHLKLITVLYVNYISIKLEGKNSYQKSHTVLFITKKVKYEHFYAVCKYRLLIFITKLIMSKNHEIISN